jgi:hypothetical protein
VSPPRRARRATRRKRRSPRTTPKPTRATSPPAKRPPPKDGQISADWTIPGDCKVKVSHELTVTSGATLTIQPGAKLSFAANTYLWMQNGKVVAKGTDEKPITFTSANSSGTAGDWDGLIFDQETAGGNVLDHVVVEYAGHEGGYAHGAITFHGDTGAGRVTITNSTFQHNGQCAIHNDRPKSRFTKVEGNTFKENGGASMYLDPDVIGSIGTNKLDEPVKVKHGNVTKTATWPKVPAYLVEDNVQIQGEGQAAILTLADKQVLKFTGGKYLWVGGSGGGGIVGKGVTFTSANATGAAGDWDGIIVDVPTSGTNLEDCVVEYAGHSGGYAHAAVTFHSDPASKLKGFKMKSCTFRHNEGGAIYPNEKECGALAADNKSEGQPICVKHE